MNKGHLATTLVLSSALFTTASWAKDSVFVGHLVDFSGPTAYVSKPYGSGVRDALQWINQNGGINGTELERTKCQWRFLTTNVGLRVKTWSRCKGGAQQIPKR